MQSDGSTRFDATEVAALTAALPPGVRFGTSSWTYPGWTDIIYEGRYPAKQPSLPLLRRYSRIPLLSTVGIDSMHYQPASPETLRAYADALPADYRCVIKVWNTITTHTWSKAQDPAKRGGPNPGFLDADLFLQAVWQPMREHFTAHTACLLLEFSAVPLAQLPPAEFAHRLDRFLSRIPHDLPLQVEVRNAELLTPGYLAVLREHGVGHCFNHWTRMPSLGTQLDLPDVITGDALVTRLMLRPGRQYVTMREEYAPFDHIVERDPVMRADVMRLVALAVETALPCYVIVGNKSEGCAPLTVLELARMVAGIP